MRLAKQGAYIDVISTNNNIHPILAETLAVYIKPLSSKHGFIIPINHQEGINYDKDSLYSMLKECTTLYTLDKKNLLYHFNLQSATDISLLYSMTKYEKLEYSKEGSILSPFYSRLQDKKQINSFIPLSRLYEASEKIFKQVEHTIKLEIPSGFDFYNNTATNVFFLLEQSGLGINYEAYKELFTPRDIKLNTVDNTVFTYYNLYNVTSRPTNAFNSVNFAAIPKSKEHRNCFRPKNDYFVEFDFDGYHLRLLCDEINHELTAESAHIQLARHYFGKEEITDDEYIQAKQINFHAIYGSIPEKHKNLPVFVKIQEYINKLWSDYEKFGTVHNSHSGKPFTKELKDMNPAKLMNYMMQSLETSRNILILKEVLRYLQNKKTSVTLYTYDALLFDFAKEDGKETLEDIKNILETGGKYPVKFKYSNNLVL